MNKKDIFTLILKVLIYILTLLLGYVGVCSFSSCTTPSQSIVQRGYIIVNDTIFLGR